LCSFAFYFRRLGAGYGPGYGVNPLSLCSDQIVRDTAIPLSRAHGRVSEDLSQCLKTPSLFQPSAGKCVPQLVDMEPINLRQVLNSQIETAR